MSLPGESKDPEFERLRLPVCISNDIFQDLIEKIACSFIFRIFLAIIAHSTAILLGIF